MKQLAVFLCFIYSVIQPASAQITITNAVFPNVGDTLHYVFGNQPGAINQIFTPPGGGQVWDLSNLQPTQQWSQIMKSPQTGMASSNFPAASKLFNPANSSSEIYWQTSNNSIKNLGYAGLDPLGLGLNLLFINWPGLEESWAPINFFDIHQSASNTLTAFDAPIAPPILLNLVPTADSFRIRISYQRVSAIDAWGTLVIPGGSFDVLRKKQTEYKSTAVDVKVAPLGWIDISTIGGQQLLPLGTDTTTTFHFLNHESKEAIAICTLNTAQNAVTGVQYKATNTTSATVSPTFDTTTIFTYPNPVDQVLHVDLTNHPRASYQLRLINNQGSSVLEQTVESGASEKDIAMPVAQLPSGIYTLIVQRNGVLVGKSGVIKI